MPSRKHHTKSRLGCLTCKRRKVRCDQAQPICGNCERLGKDCVYSDSLVYTPKSSVSDPIRRNDRIQHTRRIQGLDNESLQSTIADESLPDLELMHYWTAHSSLCTTDMPEMHHVWQVVVPKLAMSHRFLLHGVLASAALHRSWDCPVDQRGYFIELARKHHSQGLKQYIPHLQSVTEENCEALFAFSAAIGGLSFGLLQLVDDEKHPEDFIKGAIDAIDLLQGATLIALQAHRWLFVGIFGPLLGTHTPNSPETSSSWGPRIALEALLGRIQSTVYPENPDSSTPKSPIKEVYTASIQRLLELSSSHPRLEPVTRWAATIDPSFITLLKAGDPTALVILNHYGVALQAVDSFWWLRGVGERLQRAISTTIDVKWYPYLTKSPTTVRSPFIQSN